MDILRKWDVFWEKFSGPEGAWHRVLEEGLKNTLVIAFLGLAIGIVLGTLIASIKVMPKYKLLPRVLDKICAVYVGFFRGTPIVVQLLLAYYVLFPLMDVQLGSLNTCILVFGLNSAAYVSEIMRGGILSVDIGQTEAGRALGLTYGKTMTKIVLPQAIKNVVPTLGNEFIALLKETSVVSFITIVDLTKSFQNIANSTYEYIVPYIVLAVIYLVLVLIVTGIIKLIERRLRASDKR
jgi:polar amino acid transport system permease protein